MWETQEIRFSFVGLYGRILCDDARAGTGRIQQDAVEAADNSWECACVVRRDDGILGAEAVDVANEGFGTVLVAVVGKEDAWEISMFGQIVK